MKYLIPAVLLITSACATIGPEHEMLAMEIEKGFSRQETAYMKLVDRFEEGGLDRIEERMRFIEGPNIMKHAITLEDRDGNTFDDNVCKKEGEMDRAIELLEFTMAASRSYERRKAKYVRGLDGLVRGLRRAAREEFTLMRQASASLTTGLRAYNKDKAWRKEMLKSLKVPVDQAEALNKAAADFEQMLEDKTK